MTLLSSQLILLHCLLWAHAFQEQFLVFIGQSGFSQGVVFQVEAEVAGENLSSWPRGGTAYGRKRNRCRLL